MIELDSGRVLEDVAPPEVRLIKALRVRRIKELVGRRRKTPTHEREFVVQKTRVKASNERP